jgi:hypothetical protein
MFKTCLKGKIKIGEYHLRSVACVEKNPEVRGELQRNNDKLR